MDISGVFDQPATQQIADTIRNAANATGTSFQYMLSTAVAESGLNPQAAATTSSARGLYQFIDQTWLGAMKRSGTALGYGRYADAIVQTAGGRYEVPNPAMRREIMALRDDPAANAALAGALTKENEAWLAGRLGRPPTDGELYMAHVLGAAGAARLTALAFVSPGAPADLAFPGAAEANRAIFYDRQGRPRNVSDVYALLAARHSGSRVPAPASLNVAVVGNPLVLPSAPGADATAATADAPLGRSVLGGSTAASNLSGRPSAVGAAAGGTAGGEPLFVGLFSDDGQSDPQSAITPSGTRTSSANASQSASSGASLVAANGSRQMFQAMSAGSQFGR